MKNPIQMIAFSPYGQYITAKTDISHKPFRIIYQIHKPSGVIERETTNLALAKSFMGKMWARNPYLVSAGNQARLSRSIIGARSSMIKSAIPATVTVMPWNQWVMTGATRRGPGRPKKEDAVGVQNPFTIHDEIEYIKAMRDSFLIKSPGWSDWNRMLEIARRKPAWLLKRLKGEQERSNPWVVTGPHGNVVSIPMTGRFAATRDAKRRGPGFSVTYVGRGGKGSKEGPVNLYGQMGMGGMPGGGVMPGVSVRYTKKGPVFTGPMDALSGMGAGYGPMGGGYGAPQYQQQQRRKQSLAGMAFRGAWQHFKKGKAGPAGDDEAYLASFGATSKTRPQRRYGSNIYGEERPYQENPCPKCRNPIRANRGVIRGSCPHCGILLRVK
ncbi:MAG: hypothetical protein Q8O55_01195 [Dehalococcoidales bacterium]|nr:hypothetical protein [Dehalococcoidales bacterium]